MSRLRLTRGPVERVTLAVGDKVKFRRMRNRWTVRAISADGRWVICTRPFHLHGATCLYTVLDFDSGVRGPDNYGGLGYESPEEIAEAMERFEAGDAEVSVRYDVYLDIERVDQAVTA